MFSQKIRHAVMLLSVIVLIMARSVASSYAQEPTFEEKVKASVPLAPKPAPQPGASGQVSAEICKIDGAEFLGKSTTTMFKAIETYGDNLWIADFEGKIHGFKIGKGKTCKLTIDKTFGKNGILELPHKIEYLSVDGAGRLFASNGISAAYVVEKGQMALKCDTSGFIEIHPSGKWGIAPWVNSTVKMITQQGVICKKEDWVLKRLSNKEKREDPFTNVNTSTIIGDTIFIGGILVDPPDKRVVIAYTKEGKELFRFGNIKESFAVDSFGWIHAMKGCKTGICILDSNARKLTQWTDKGEVMGAIELGKLFDLKYPWMPDFTIGKDGFAWFVAAQNREPSKSGVAEGIIYRVKGL